MEKQVDKSVYRFGKYTKIDRWSSYYYQLREILSRHPESILEVGVGEGMIRDYLRSHTDIKYQSLDIADDLNPDIVGSVTRIPLQDAAVSIACAFEVLEHIPFENFEKAVSELARVARDFIIISLPHFNHPVLVFIKLPLLKIKFTLRIPHPKVHVFDGQHYWEIGKQGYPPKKVKNILKKYGNLVSEFIPFENQSHHFFVLEKLKK